MTRNKVAATLIPGSFQFDGILGSRIDTIADARIRTKTAREKIYPETEEAFRKRVDDSLNPGRGMWQGEFWGKWMLSVTAAYDYYGDPELREFIAQAAEGLISTQDENGYIGTYRDSTFYGPGTWNIWSRKYTLWGLLECHQITGKQEILDAAIRFCDHLMSEVGPGNHDIIRTGQFNGLPSTSILTPVVMLYRETGEKRFLDFARHIVVQWSRHPDGPPDILRKGLEGRPIHEWFPNPDAWAKSYEFISCVEGMVNLYEVTGDRDLLTAAENIHAAIVRWERSPVGSVSFNDKFVGSRQLKNTVAEICDAVYWNRLSHALLRVTGKPHYADEIERTLYNALLSGMNSAGDWGLRRLRLSHRHIEAHRHCRLDHHQCCVDNLPRGLFQAAETALFAFDPTLPETLDVQTGGGEAGITGEGEGGIAVALYSPGTGSIETASGNTVTIRISGGYPFRIGAVKISVNPEHEEEFILAVRIPGWAAPEISTPEDGATKPRGPGWYAIRRTWRKGDSVSLVMEPELRFEFFDPTPADPAVVAWHEKAWPKMGFMVEGKGQQSDLTEADLQPHEKAVCLLYGPVVLTRDRRVTGKALFAEVSTADLPSPASPEDGGHSIREVDAPPDIHAAFEVEFPNGNSERLCDFASAGNTWDENSAFDTWIPIDRDR